MTPEEMKKRTKAFALMMIEIAERLPKSTLGNNIRAQAIRCGTSVGSNYRAACRAKSPADFLSKMGTVEEETDECMFWLEVIAEKKLLARELVEPVYKEADEILSIVVASINTTKKGSR